MYLCYDYMDFMVQRLHYSVASDKYTNGVQVPNIY